MSSPSKSDASKRALERTSGETTASTPASLGLHGEPRSGTAETELGTLRERFEVGRADQRSLALVRSVTALLSGAGAVLLLLSDLPIPVFLAALLGVLMSLVWWAQGRKAARMAATPEAHSLAIYQLGFVISDGDQVTSVRFADLARLEVDEERLEIVAILRPGSPSGSASGRTGDKLHIEPRYPGLAIHELVHRLQDAADADSHHVRESEPGRKPQPGSGQ